MQAYDTAIPEEYEETNIENNNSTTRTESDIPVLAVIPKTMIVEFGLETVSGKTKFAEAITGLQPLMRMLQSLDKPGISCNMNTTARQFMSLQTSSGT
jgi:hypothetical protein